MAQDVTYKGKSMTIHVQLDVLPTVTPIGRIPEHPTYAGQSGPMRVETTSPSLYEVDIKGPKYDLATYRGRSQAIHVPGYNAPPAPPPPIESCVCVGAGAGGGITDHFTRVVATYGFMAWGTSEACIPWLMSSSDLGGVSVDGARGIMDIGETDGAYAQARLVFPAARVFMGADVISEAAFHSGGGADANENFLFYFGPDGSIPPFNTYNVMTFAFQETVSLGVYTKTARLTDGFGNTDFVTLVTDTPRSYHQTRFLIEGGNFNVYVWTLPGSQPMTPMVSLPLDSTTYAEFDVITYAAGSGSHLEVDSVDLVGLNSDNCADCVDCQDPTNPGFPLPAFTPGYMPVFRRQIGDPTTSLDSFICTFESGAMALAWHTRGAVDVWGGELIPYSGRTEASIIASGSNLGDVQTSWMHWGQHLEIRTGQTWADLVLCLTEGRAVILQGDYGVFVDAEKCQIGFEDNHAISVYPYQIADRYLIGDPLCADFIGRRITSLQAYAEALGAFVFGAESPQRILFAVTRPWIA